MPVNHDGKDDPCFAYTLWRRTLLNQDERAWCVVYADYQRQVCFWIKRQLRFVVDETTMQTLVDDAFVKMAGTFSRHPEKFADYPNVAALLGLLRFCAQRVVQDYVAAAQQTVPVISLDAIDEPCLEATAPPSDLWSVLEGLLHDEKEWLVVTKLLGSGSLVTGVGKTSGRWANRTPCLRHPSPTSRRYYQRQSPMNHYPIT